MIVIDFPIKPERVGKTLREVNADEIQLWQLSTIYNRTNEDGEFLEA